MNLRRIALIIVIFLPITFWGQSSYIQTQSILFKHLTTEDGLPSNRINTITQDHYGFIWIGTENGLCRYDGSDMSTIKHKNNSLKEIIDVVQSRYDSSLLYIGTKRGFFSFDQNTGKFHQHVFNNHYIPFISGIYEINDSILWIGSTNGLYKYNHRSNHIIPHALSKDTIYIQHNINCIFSDQKNRLWVGTSHGLYQYDPMNDRFLPQTMIRTRRNSSLIIKEISEDKSGKLWIATYGYGLLEFDPDKHTYHFPLPNYRGPLSDRLLFLTTIAIDRQGIIWCGSSGSGIFNYDQERNLFNYFMSSDNKVMNLSENYINNLIIDHSGVVWIGMKERGIDIFKKPIIQFENYSSLIVKGEVEKLFFAGAFHEDPLGNIWIASAKKGLILIDSLNHVIRHFTHDPSNKYSLGSNHISSITSDIKGNLWLGTNSKGIYSFNRREGKFYHLQLFKKGKKTPINGHIHTVFDDHQGCLWFSTSEGGIYRMKKQQKRVTYYQLDSRFKKPPNVFNIYKDHSGALWIASRKGLFLYDPAGDEFHLIPLSPADSIQEIFSIFENQKKILYVATKQNIFIYHPKMKQFTPLLNKNKGVFRSIRFAVVDSFGYFWVADNKGIASFKNTERIIRYDKFDGIKNSRFYHRSILLTRNGYIYMSNSTGFLRFKTIANQIDILPRIKIFRFNHITESYIQDTMYIPTVIPQQKTVLPYDHYTLFFDFTLFDFSFPSRNTYAYKLENVQKNWRYLGNKHQLTLVNLPPGKYTLSVKSWDRKGIPCAKPASISFTILPPFWQTWLFRISFLIILALLITLIFHLRLRSVRKRNRELQEINDNLNNEITYRKQVEKLLRESETKYRVLVESIKESIFSVNSEGKLVFLNKTAAARLGAKPQDFVGKSFWEILPPRPKHPFLDEIQQVIYGQKRLSTDKTITIDGKKRFFHLTLQPVINESGTTEHALGIATEITDKVELEEQLRQSQKMEAIGQLAGGVAHDFNNLLAIIRGYTFLLLKDKKLKKSFRDIINEIDSAGEKAQSLTRQLLAFSRKQLLEPQTIDLNQHVQKMETMLTRLIGENIQLIIEPDSNLKPITADPGQIEQIIFNMAVNARDAMPKGGKLTISTKQIHVSDLKQKLPFEVKQNDYSALILKDTGIGMSKETQQKIFDPFFTTKEKDKGTGLGLSTVFGIIKQSDGYIWVDSLPGKGTTFIIYFPSSSQELKQLQKEQKEFVKHKGSGTILLVEDEEGVRRMMKRTIQFLGYKVFEAENAEFGISLIEEHQKDIVLILTDVVMPGMTGVEMRDKINSRFNHIPLLFMSGYTDDEIVRQGLKSHDIHFIQKPFSADILAQKIEEVLQKQ